MNEPNRMSVYRLKDMRRSLWETLAAYQRYEKEERSWLQSRLQREPPHPHGSVTRALVWRGLIVRDGQIRGPKDSRYRPLYKLTTFGHIAAFAYRKGLYGDVALDGDSARKQ